MKLKYIIIFIFLTLILFNLNLNGFIFGHEGHAGPHLLSASFNGNDSGFYYDYKFTDFYDNVYYSLYNHHPKLFFYFSSKLLSYFLNINSILITSYLYAVIFNFIGLYLVFYLITCKTKNQNFATFSILALLGTSNASSFLNLTTFDAFSILSASILFYYMINIDKEYNITKTFIWSLLMIFVLNISWYNHLFFYVFIFINLTSKLINKKFISFTKSLNFIPILVAFFSSILIIGMIYNDFDLIPDEQKIGNKLTKGFGDQSYLSFNFVDSIKELIKYFFKSCPFIFIIYLITKKKNKQLEINYSSILIQIICTLLLTVLIFFYLDFRWNMIHNFLSLYIITFVILIISYLIKTEIKINSVIFYLQLFLTISVISYYSFLDLKESEKTEYIVDSFESLNIENGKKYYFYIGGKTIDDLNDDDIPLNFNKGRLFLFGSLPISKGFTAKLFTNETIIIKNDGTFQLY